MKQVEDAFHVQMRNYLVDGKMHIANDRDPQIPQALAPVITGIASLHDFRPIHFSHPGAYVKRDLKTGKYTVVPPSTGHNEPVGIPDTKQSAAQKSMVKKDGSSGIHPDFTYNRSRYRLHTRGTQSLRRCHHLQHPAAVAGEHADQWQRG